MNEPSGPTHGGRLGRWLLAALLFALFAPVGLIAVPLAVLMVPGRKSGRERVVMYGAAFVALWWLLVPGETPDQAVRSATLIAAVSFALLSFATDLSTTHRTLVATGMAFFGTAVGMLVLRISPTEIGWIVEHRIGFATRELMGQMWMRYEAMGQVAEPTAVMLRQTENLLEGVARFVGVNAAALFGLQLLLGFAIAFAIYWRVSSRPRGRSLGRLRDFSFSEHLGWMAVLGLVGILVPKLVMLKSVASNLVVMGAALYAVRGIAVVTFVGSSAGAGILPLALLVLATLFMLPLVAAGAIVLGVLDSGLDIRKRWEIRLREDR